MTNRFLIDTHCWLWWNGEPERLGSEARHAIADGANEILFSVASAWEIAIKHGLGKLKLPLPPEKYVPARVHRNSMAVASIQLDHVLNIARLPRHHRDPFDRILISQAQVEHLTLITADDQITAYNVGVLWAVA